MDQERTKEFLSFRPELRSFLFRTVADRGEVEDIIQDSYVKASENIDRFEGRSSFKTWVFAIALNTARSYLRKRKRWSEFAQDYGSELHLREREKMEALTGVYRSDPEARYEAEEHIAFCFLCIAKSLPLRQQVCLLLKEIYDFKTAEIICISGLSEGKVKHSLADARKNLKRIFQNRCALVNKEGVCRQCRTLYGILQPERAIDERLRELKFTPEEAAAGDEGLLRLRTLLTKSVDPFSSRGAQLFQYMAESSPAWEEEGKKKKVLPIPSEEGPLSV